MTVPTNGQCQERSALSTELAQSIREVYLLKQAYDGVKNKKNEDTRRPWAALEGARNIQLAAEHAFNDHINQHGCKT